MRTTDDQVEVLGVERSWQLLKDADVMVLVVDAQQAQLSQTEQTVLEGHTASASLLVFNKCDTLTPQQLKTLSQLSWPVPCCFVSVQTQQGLSQVMAWLKQQIQQIPDGSTLKHLMSQRQLERLEYVLTEVTAAQRACETMSLPLDLVTVPLTSALKGLEGMLGKDASESVLDSVFSRFCVGK